MPQRSNYPLAARSMRRRRMILNRSSIQTSSESGSAQTLQPIIDRSAEIPELTLRLQDSQPLNWLILGDSLLPQSEDGLPQFGFVDVFRKYLNTSLGRSSDSVKDGTAPRFKMTEAIEQLEFHLWRKPPDIIILMCGAADAEGGIQKCEEFENALCQLIRRVKQRGLNVLINTPPCLPETDESLLVDRLVYLEAVKAASAEEEIPLIDHWKHWEWAAIEVGGTEAWYQPDLMHPGIRGFEQMTHLLFKECGLSPIRVS